MKKKLIPGESERLESCRRCIDSCHDSECVLCACINLRVVLYGLIQIVQMKEKMHSPVCCIVGQGVRGAEWNRDPSRLCESTKLILGQSY